MTKKRRIQAAAEAAIRIARRREEVAHLFLQEGLSPQEIAEYSVYSLKTIKKDVAYIKAHPEDFDFYKA